ncbi:MAG TPA: hypothetical protein VFD74_03825, partial [Thermoleophilia bacterium]|nr:hypothetical protein [Thermoleophilia bacterium]
VEAPATEAPAAEAAAEPSAADAAVALPSGVGSAPAEAPVSGEAMSGVSQWPSDDLGSAAVIETPAGADVATDSEQVAPEDAEEPETVADELEDAGGRAEDEDSTDARKDSSVRRFLFGRKDKQSGEGDFFDGPEDRDFQW